MESIIYLLQVCACTAVFYLFYYLFLTRLTFFVTNRWYLLVTVVLSFIIPLIKIQLSQPHAYTGVVEHVVYQYTSQPEQATPIIIKADVPKNQPISWGVILRYTYISAVLGLTIHLLITLFAFFKRMKGKRVTKVGKVNILSGNDKIINGSFLNYIFLNDNELSPDEIQQIIAHEMLHVKLYHSVDRIIVKIAQIILWFNPFIYLYARSVEENHEFEVDRAVARQTDKHNYANLLVHLSVAGQGMLYHNFSKVPLKKRITMLFNQPSANMKRIVYVLVVPVVLISCLAFARIKSRDNSASDTKKNIPFSFSRKTIKIPASGKLMDVIHIETPSGRWQYKDVALLPGTTLGFFINHKLYTEEQFISLPVRVLKDLSNTDKPLTVTGIGTPNTMVEAMKALGYNADLTGFGSIIVFKVKEPKPDKVYDKKEEKAPTSFQAANNNHLYKSEAEKSGAAYPNNDDAIDKEKIANLFVRTELKKASGRSYDEVATRSKGTYCYTEIPHNGKVGFFIDRDLYSEEDFNKVPDRIKLIIANAGASGVSDPDGFSSLRKHGYTADLKGYDAVFYFNYKLDLIGNWDSYKDTIRKSSTDPKLKAKLKNMHLSPGQIAYMKTDDYRTKKKLSDDIYNAGLIDIKITPERNKTGMVFTWNGHKYTLLTFYGQEKVLNSLLKPGDEIQLKVFSTGWGKDQTLVTVIPASVNKSNEKIFQLAEADKLPTTPFLYEPNKVRYADGQLSNIKKYANGKWKSAMFETVNGYKFYISFRPDAPAMKGLEWGDHVRLRFVHEVSNGDKTFSIADWVSISPDANGYGIRNPELFDKYYQEEKTTSVSSDKLSTKRVQVHLADSVSFDTKRGIQEFFGNAHNMSNGLMVSADYIRIDNKNHILFASSFFNAKTKKRTGSPIVSMNGKNSECDSILYEWPTQKAKFWGQKNTDKSALSR